MSALAIKNVSRASLYDATKVHVDLLKRFLFSIPYIGRVTVTSTWRPPGGAGGSRSFHKYVPSLAVDFVPDDRDLWSVFNKLVSLGWQRIGIRPDAHMIHLDMGVEFGLAKPYLFFEGIGGKDLGLLSRQPASRLQQIPGYSTSNVRVFPARARAAQKMSWLIPGIVLGIGGIATYLILR